jgi:phosphoglycolate phosphatase
LKKYKAVIFDMDGTVLDTLEDLKDAVNYTMRDYSIKERSLDEVRQFVGNGLERLLELCVPGGKEHPQFYEMMTFFKEYYSLHSNDKTRPYDGVLPLLRELKDEGYKLAIVSNKVDSAVKDLAQIYFDGVVETAIGESEGVARKPAPDMVNAALKELDISKEEAVYVGDSEVDLMTASNSGLDCISVLWGFRDREFLKERGAVMFAEKPSDVLAFMSN